MATFRNGTVLIACSSFLTPSVFLGPFKNQHLLKILRAQGKKKIYSLYCSCSRHNPKALFCDRVNNCLIHVKQAAFHTHSVEKTELRRLLRKQLFFQCSLFVFGVPWPPKTAQTCGCMVTAHGDTMPGGHGPAGASSSHCQGHTQPLRLISASNLPEACWIEHLGVFVLGGWGDVSAGGMMGVFTACWQIPRLPVR